MPPDWDDDEVGAPRNWDEDSDLWEHQGHPLSVHRLQDALSQAAPDLPVRVVLYDGTGEQTELVPMEVGFTGRGERPTAVVLTVHPEHR